ncbi:MAG TPA: PIN domain-containing protein [Clostridiaceae bacterium]|jgi:predicted nucleic acid-binding protein|nr:PIN domain-containing protein [Clostridiaceae bacterium]
MKSILIDAGPIIALYRKNDLYHERALEFIKSFRGRLITTWPVITEVMHELYRPDVQEKFLLWIERGGLEIANIDQDSISGLISFIKKYSDIPMDLADATLMLYAEKTGIKEIATIDSDFNVYRIPKKDYLKNIFPVNT